MRKDSSKMLYCRWCDKQFSPNTTKQIYCTSECRQEASKEKILERYHLQKRKNRKGKEKKCGGGCNTLLSIYNDSGICDNCLVHQSKMKTFMRELKDYFDYEQD
jgi:hypothetical protein